MGLRHDTLPLFAECAVSYWSRSDFAELSIVSLGAKAGFEIAQTSPIMGRISGTLGWFRSTAKTRSNGIYNGVSLDLFFNQGTSRHGISLGYTGIGKIKVGETTTYSSPTLTTTYYNNGYGLSSSNTLTPGAPTGKVPVELSMSEFRISYTISLSPSGKTRKPWPKDSAVESTRFR